MAAGLSIHAAHYEDFCAAFDAEARAVLTEQDVAGAIETDGELAVADFTVESAQALRDGGPWAQHFPEPSFEGVFEVLHVRTVGADGVHLKYLLRPVGTGLKLDAIAFFATQPGVLPEATQIRAAFKLDINEWNGRTSVQLLVDYCEDAALTESDAA